MKLEPASWGLATWQSTETGYVFAIETRDVDQDHTSVKVYKKRNAICGAKLKLVNELKTSNGPLLEYTGSLLEIKNSFNANSTNFASAELKEIGPFDELFPIIVDGLESMLGLQISLPNRPVRAKISFG